MTATFPTSIRGQEVLALHDTGPSVGCVSYDCYNKLSNLPEFRLFNGVNVQSVGGKSTTTWFR